MKFLGIDYGEAKVGLAVGDDESRLSLPYKILNNSGRKKLLDDLADVVKAEAVETVVVGLPINTIGESSAQTENVRRFADDLRGRLPAAVALHDERFSSQEAKKLGAGSVAFRRDRRDDDVAAMIMLQSYLDADL